MGQVPYEYIGSVGTNNGKILEPMTIYEFLAELLQTAELFKWKYFLRKSHEFSQDLGI